MLARDYAIAISLYISVCRPTLALYRKKKNTWSQVISTQQLKPMWFCDWHRQWMIDRITQFQTLATGILIVIHPVCRRMGKNFEFCALPSWGFIFWRERDWFLIYSVFVKNEYHRFPPLPLILLPKCTRIRLNIFSSFLLCVTNWREQWNKLFVFRCIVNANTLPKLIVTQSWP